MQLSRDEGGRQEVPRCRSMVMVMETQLGARAAGGAATAASTTDASVMIARFSVHHDASDDDERL